MYPPKNIYTCHYQLQAEQGTVSLEDELTST